MVIPEPVKQAFEIHNNSVFPDQENPEITTCFHDKAKWHNKRVKLALPVNTATLWWINIMLSFLQHLNSETVTQWVEQSFDPASSSSLIPTEATHSKMSTIYWYFSWASQSHPHISKQ